MATHDENPAAQRGRGTPHNPQHKPEPCSAAEGQALPQWRVILHNDDENTFDFVIQTVELLTPLSDIQAVRRVLEAHMSGLSRLLVTHLERVELYQQQFARRNLTVSIEPV